MLYQLAVFENLSNASNRISLNLLGMFVLYNFEDSG